MGSDSAIVLLIGTQLDLAHRHGASKDSEHDWQGHPQEGSCKYDYFIMIALAQI
jgi:hypothetical protein